MVAADLDDAREALRYWERRARRLPRRQVRRRREARAMARRWQARVAQAERDRYGRGLAGTLLLLASEGRLPEPARQVGLRLARRGTQLAAVAAGTLVALMTLTAIATIALVAAVL